MDRDGLSRADISRRLGMSKPTVSQCVTRLMSRGLLSETGPGGNPTGKKATRLAFNRRWACVAGVDIGNFRIRAGLFDLSGQRLGFTETPLPDVASGPAIFDRVERDLVSLLGRTGFTPDNAAAVVIGVPGVRDADRGLNRLAPFMTEWEDRDLTLGLARRVCGRVTVANNVNLGMLGEQWAGSARDVRDAVYLEFGIGVGAGILLDGRVVPGAAGAAGEIAYARFDGTPRREAFRNIGVFEERLSTRAILSDYAASGGRPLPPDPAEAVARVFDLYDSGDDAARSVVGRVLELTGRAFASLAALLNPEVIIVGGGMGPCLMRYAPRFEEELRRYVPYPPRLRPAGCGSAAVVAGAARYALDGLGPEGLITLSEQRHSHP